MNKIMNSKEEILKAAIIVFQEKGLHGARMQEIADKANISKSVLHYYYQNKETLYNEVFTDTVNKIFPIINSILSSNSPLESKIKNFVYKYIDLLILHPYSAGFIMGEISYNGDNASELIVQRSGWNITKFVSELKNYAKQKNKRNFDALDFILTMFSLCVYPFIGIPIHLKRYNMTHNEYMEYVKGRKSKIYQILLNQLQ